MGYVTQEMEQLDQIQLNQVSVTQVPYQCTTLISWTSPQSLQGWWANPQSFTHPREFLIDVWNSFQKIHNANVFRPSRRLAPPPLNGLSRGLSGEACKRT